MGNPSSKWVWYHVWDWAQVTVPPIMEVDNKALNNKNLVSKMIIFHFHELPQGGPLPVINRVMNYNCMYRGHNPSYIPIYFRPVIVGKKQHVFFFCIYPASPQTWRRVKKRRWNTTQHPGALVPWRLNLMAVIPRWRLGDFLWVFQGVPGGCLPSLKI